MRFDIIIRRIHLENPSKKRGDILIHAGKKVNKQVCAIEPFRSILAKHGYSADNLPTGAIIAKGHLVECFHDGGSYAILEAYFHYDVTISGNEYAFGWFAPGRFFELDEVTTIEPIPEKGQLGLWNYPLNLKP